MPAQAHTRKANTPKKRRMWNHVRNSMLRRGASAGRADMVANGVVKRASGRGKRRTRRA